MLSSQVVWKFMRNSTGEGKCDDNNTLIQDIYVWASSKISYVYMKGANDTKVK
jgi:hypothetical protein